MRRDIEVEYESDGVAVRLPRKIMDPSKLIDTEKQNGAWQAAYGMSLEMTTEHLDSVCALVAS